MRTSLILIPLALALTAATARAADSDVQSELLANVSALKSGGTGAEDSCLVALKLTTHDGWHIYWNRNSGDAGIPTDVKWSVSPGWKIQPLEMPVPERFTSAGPITSYGYSGTVLLLARLSPDPAAKPTAAPTITADASWLCCQTECVPGSKKLDITLPLADHSTPANTDEFTKAQSLIPADKPPDGIQVTARATAGDKKGDAKIHLDLTTAPSTANAPAPPDVFPASEKVQVTDSILHVGKNDGTGDTFTFTVHMMPSQKDPAGVPFLITYTDNGQRKGFFTPIDLTPATQAK
ncbi:MAG TPA: protein-disulfide reductase DsbD domain-containing protein [Phycisphaerae bacterium]|nr:protein-disulfide reductase DsbD domain-containing protein [Phycisphaerae bacterium]